MKIFLIYMVLLLSIGGKLLSDDNVMALGPYMISNIDGMLTLEGIMRRQTSSESSIDLFKQADQAREIRSNLRLALNSYFWNPKVATLDISGEISPGAQDNTYIVLPYTSESVTSNRLQASMTLLSGLPVSFNIFGGFGSGYTKRNYDSDLELSDKSYGASMNFSNIILPLSISYNNYGWKERDLRSNYEYFYNTESLSLSANKNLGTRSTNSLNGSFEDLTSDYRNTGLINNKIITANLSNRLDLTEGGASNINSNLYYNRSEGDHNYERLTESAEMSIQLPEQFKTILGYQYVNNTQENIQRITHNPMIKLENQLYESLHSYIYYQYYNISQEQYRDVRNNAGVGINYTKIIPFGRLYINYELNFLNEDYSAPSSDLWIFNEECWLEDGKNTLLKNPNIDETTLIVRDASGTIIYQLNLDYIVYKRNSYLEISRVPGGRIPNKSTVYADYKIVKLEPFSYNSISNILETRIVCDERLFEVYFKLNTNHYNDIVTFDSRAINEIDQKVFGLQTNYDYFSGGIEGDIYRSTVLPYNSVNLFIDYSDNLVQDLLLSVRGNYKYTYYPVDRDINRYLDFSGRCDYLINDWLSWLNEGGYRYQNGRNFNNKNLNLKSELVAFLSKTYIRLGFDAFFQIYETSSISYLGLYLKFERRF